MAVVGLPEYYRPSFLKIRLWKILWY